MKKESKEDKRLRKLKRVTPRHKFRKALFTLRLLDWKEIKIDKVWSNRKNIYKCLRELGCEWSISKSYIGERGQWLIY